MSYRGGCVSQSCRGDTLSLVCTGPHYDLSTTLKENSWWVSERPKKPLLNWLRHNMCGRRKRNSFTQRWSDKITWRGQKWGSCFASGASLFSRPTWAIAQPCSQHLFRVHVLGQVDGSMQEMPPSWHPTGVRRAECFLDLLASSKTVRPDSSGVLPSTRTFVHPNLHPHPRLCLYSCSHTHALLGRLPHLLSSSLSYWKPNQTKPNLFSWVLLDWVGSMFWV